MNNSKTTARDSAGAAVALLGHNVQYWRGVRGLTLLELATHTGITPEILLGIESGTFDPTLDMLDQLAHKLEVQHQQLFEQPNNHGRAIRA